MPRKSGRRDDQPGQPDAEIYSVEAVNRACSILEAFRNTDELLRLTDVARRANLSPTTAFRILMTLVGRRFVERVAGNLYRCRICQKLPVRIALGYAALDEREQFCRTVTNGIRIAASVSGVTLITVDNKGSRNVALRNVRALIEKEITVAIEYQKFSDIAPDIASAFQAAAIPLIAVDIPHPGVATYFGADPYAVGKIAGRCLGQYLRSEWSDSAAELLVLGNLRGGGARSLGITDGLTECLPENVRIPTTHLDTEGRYENSLRAVRRHLRWARPDRLLIGGTNDCVALGALEACRELGWERRCAIVGVGASIDARLEMRRPGTSLVGSVALFPEDYGEKVVQLACDIATGKPVPSAVFAKHQIVTPANVDRLFASDFFGTARGTPVAPSSPLQVFPCAENSR